MSVNPLQYSDPNLAHQSFIWESADEISTLIFPPRSGHVLRSGFPIQWLSRQGASVQLKARWLRVETPAWHWMVRQFGGFSTWMPFGLDANIDDIADVKVEVSGMSFGMQVLGQLIIVHRSGKIYRVGVGRPFDELEVAARNLRDAMYRAGWKPAERESRLGRFIVAAGRTAGRIMRR